MVEEMPKKKGICPKGFLALTALGVLFGSGDGLALVPPCQRVTAWPVETTVHYKVTDPVSNPVREETRALNSGDQVAVESLQADGGRAVVPPKKHNQPGGIACKAKRFAGGVGSFPRHWR